MSFLAPIFMLKKIGRILLDLMQWFVASQKHNFHVLLHWRKFFKAEHRFCTFYTDDGKMLMYFCECGKVFYESSGIQMAKKQQKNTTEQLKRIREQFQREKPSLADLIRQAGKDTSMPMKDYLALLDKEKEGGSPDGQETAENREEI